MPEQGIIVPLDPNEDAPITSSNVLVTKRSKNTSEHKEINREASLRQYRFCVDFRYLNSQVKHFSYAIPDLQELTESLTQRIPNYITSIDLYSGFFEMNIDSENTKNWCIFVRIKRYYYPLFGVFVKVMTKNFAFLRRQPIRSDVLA
jgi:hypothetical protein